MKVLLLALFIGWALNSARMMFKRQITKLEDEAKKNNVTIDKIKQTWRALSLLTISCLKQSMSF